MNPWVGSRLGLAATQLVVLSVGFRSPRELGKFYAPLALDSRYTLAGLSVNIKTES